ncbi:MAG: creatinine amidohydrolase [Candidatus Hydrogenedentes bacterium]|nr:creatinine amidohydrolase [Candidatus Hydrogenedentota bacterium]
MEPNRFEEMRPQDLRRAIEETPVAYIPLGTLEFHGWHMPLGFDALKAAAICARAAERTGGVVLPPSFFGFAGGHKTYLGSIVTEEAHFEGNLRVTIARLIDMGFHVLVILTGHYPQEQVQSVKRIAEEVSQARRDITVLALAEYEAYPNETRADHAAKWETSIGMYLMPELVDVAQLSMQEDPLHGIGGEDPRASASAELGKETVDTVVNIIASLVQGSLMGRGPRTR